MWNFYKRYKFLNWIELKWNWYAPSKWTLTHRSARTWPEHFAPKHADFVCLCPCVTPHLTFFLALLSKREKKVCKVARCLGFLCQDWKMLEILDHQTVLEQNLENNLITITKEVIFANFLYSKYIKLITISVVHEWFSFTDLRLYFFL